MFYANLLNFPLAATVVLLIVAASDVAAKDTFPAPLKRCRVDDEACIVRQGQAFFQNFKNGLPDRQIPSLEPLQLGTLRVVSGGPGDSLHFTLVLTDTTLHNFGDSVVVKSLKGFTKDLTKPLKLTFVTAMPELELHAKYDVNGKILILPIVSQGDVVMKLTKVLAKTRISAEPDKRADGRTYLKIVEYKTVTKVGTGRFNMSNLFNDNEELRETTLKTLNDQWDALSNDVQPKINEALDRVFKMSLQRLWDNIPYDEFFEDD
ncbi:circadian clock-controlled protein [Scaptodrosophila lebanonensis]|uniref:Circadian clock-controlled protein n=1 Tax=Drosophila lebanonensis TaxID=7225 RepID=A0A6J2TSK4_DROLE|nr:circadian clock-controlled protein [Scaptodrosophila lebanonensis]